MNKAGEPHYIGLAAEIRELSQVVKVSAEEGIYKIDEELSIFSGIGSEHPVPSANQRLKKKAGDDLVQDDFAHEQCLVIREGTKSILLSGCAHHGILNILDRYRELYGVEPDVVISGFHMMRRHGYSDADINMIIDTALALRKYKTVFYTGHCTGVEPYSAMKKLMGDRLHYVHSGDEIRVQTGLETTKPVKKKRSEYMKWHKLFAWGTVVCFVMTMVTGYRRK